MNNIKLTTMTKELARQFYKNFQLDPELFLDKSEYRAFEYSETWSDHRIERYAALGRIYMAVLLNDEPIGEIVLKDIDNVKNTCVLGISLQNDQYKNKGIGTAALKKILDYAFAEIGIETVYADAVITNQRSRHVLRKAGFKETNIDNTFAYYQCNRRKWLSKGSCPVI